MLLALCGSPVVWENSRSHSADPDVRGTIDRGEYVAAELLARDGLAAVERSARADGLDAARWIDGVVESLQRQGRICSDEVRELAERAYEITRDSLAPDDPDLRATLTNLARVRLHIDQDLDAALALADEAIEIAGSEADALDTARCWVVRAEILRELGDADRMRTALDEATARLGPRSPPTIRADVAYLEGRLAFLESDFRSAIEHLEEGRRHVEASFGPDHPEVARMLGQLVFARGEAGLYEEARADATRCLEIVETRYGREHSWFAGCLFGLAFVDRNTGRLTSARARYDESLGIRERLCGPDHMGLIGLLNQYAGLLAQTWELRKSKIVHERALAIMERTIGPQDHRLGWVLAGYGNVLRKLGDAEGAERAFRRAIDLVEAMEEPNRLLWSGNMINLAYLEQSLGEFESALRLYEEALPVFEEANPSTNVLWRSEAKSIYADLLSQMGRHDEAFALFEEALALRLEAFGTDHVRTIETLSAYGLAKGRAGDVSGGLDLLRRGLEISERMFGGETEPVSRLLQAIAQYELRSGRSAEAYRDALRAERVRVRSLRMTVPGLVERQSLDYVRSFPTSLPFLVSLSTAGDEAASPDAREVWDVVVRSRALVVDELAARHRSLSRDGVPQELVDALTSARERLAGVVVRGGGPGYAERLRLALEEREQAEQSVAEVSADFRRLRATADVGFPEVEAALPAGSALIAFLRYLRFERPAEDGDARETSETSPPPLRSTSSYAAFVLAPDASEPVIVSLGTSASIDRAVAAWMGEASTKPPAIRPAAIAAAERYRTVGADLRRRIWDPVRPLLDGASRVFIVPDGTLNLVTFAALPSDDGEFLVERTPEMHYLSAERDLVEPTASESKRSGLLAVGGPDFDAPTSAEQLASLGTEAYREYPTGPADPAEYRGERPSCEDFRSMRFDPLPLSTVEVDEIVTLWEGRSDRDRSPDDPPDTLRLTGPYAQEAWFKSLVAEHAVVHVATHAFVLDETCGAEGSLPSHPLLLSGLAFAGANRRLEADVRDEDGILTAEEIASLDLTGADWVVLSGCDTGRGRILNGEGVLGLRRALQVAGARSLIMSLWEVDDDATRRWMRALYESRMDGRTTVEAVRSAASRVIEETRRAGVPDHPFGWGAFVAVGDWR